jgi:ribonucleoside-diphosphate reductase alpha chain
VCQSQSVNLFLPGDVHKRDLHQIHLLAWKRGMKSLYYCRSLSIQRADTVSDKVAASDILGAKVLEPLLPVAEKVAYEECLSCQ